MINMRSRRAILVRLIQRGFERGFEGMRLRYRDLLQRALGHRPLFLAVSFAFIAATFFLVPYLGQNFFPSVDSGQILMHVRGDIGTRVEESARNFAEVEKAIREIIPAEDLGAVVDNIGIPNSGINMSYNNTGIIGAQDGDIQIALNPGHRPTPEYVRLLRDKLPVRFPGTTFSFLPADITSSNSELRGTDADRSAVSVDRNSISISITRKSFCAKFAWFRALPTLASNSREKVPSSRSTSIARVLNTLASPSAM